MIRAVLFDMDGTVLDSEPLYRACWERAMDDFRLNVDREEFFRGISGMNVASMQAYCKKVYGNSFPFAELRERRRAYLMKELEKTSPSLKPGVPEIFVALKEAGIKIALATSSGYAYAMDLIKRCGIDVYFDAVIAGDRVTNGKPHPEIFLRAAELVGVPPAQCVVAEDSKNGVIAGHAAGMHTVMIPDLQPCTEELKPLLWHCIDTLWELPALVLEENQNEQE